MTQFSVTVAQLDSKADKERNVRRMCLFVDEAATRDADLMTVPEMATYVGGVTRYLDVAEDVRADNRGARGAGPRAQPLPAHGESVRGYLGF